MLIKYGFRVDRYGRLLNPAAVFCADRNRYYAMLARADQGTDEALEEWCSYVLVGVRDEVRKVDRLADYTFLKGRILHPALAYARERELVTPQEHAVLTLAVEKRVTKAGDLEPAMPGLNLAQRTYQVKKLLQSKMLVPTKEKGRQYTIGFFHATLLRGVVAALTTEGFISTAMAVEAAPAAPRHLHRRQIPPNLRAGRAPGACWTARSSRSSLGYGMGYPYEPAEE